MVGCEYKSWAIVNKNILWELIGDNKFMLKSIICYIIICKLGTTQPPYQ